QIKFASNSFFFEEGQAEHFSAAKYGEFRVNLQGELLLVSLLDQKLQPL
ncbi:MAG: GDYXXLXY domain-containing protein, partial [Shewanella sp.]